MVLPDSCKAPRTLHYSGAERSLNSFRIRAYNALWEAFLCHFCQLSDCNSHMSGPQPQEQAPGLGYSAFARRY